MIWWLWLVVGIALLALEMLTPGGFFTIFFGVSALVVGVLARFGLAGPPWMQWVLFSVLSVVSLLLFRKPLLQWIQRREQRRPEIDTLVGETAIVLEEVGETGVGKAELRGTSWTARSATGAVLPTGARCRVVRVDGLTIWLQPE
jgi:membrane protein implicated in regulation of membrane protease activity